MVTGVVVATNPRPTIISSSVDCTVKLWDLDYILTLFFRSSYLCIPHSRGKRNDLPSDNPSYHYARRTKAELIDTPMFKTAPSPDADTSTPVDMSVSKTNENYDAMFEDDETVEDIVGPPIDNPPALKRKNSFTNWLLRGNATTPKLTQTGNMIQNYVKAEVHKSKSGEVEQAQAQKKLQKKLAKKRGEVELDNSTSSQHEQEMLNVKTRSEAETARHRYSMDLRRGKAAEQLAKRLEKKMAKNSNKVADDVDPDPNAVDNDDGNDIRPEEDTGHSVVRNSYGDVFASDSD
jgi:hypothetical protein